jgi:hypothetical protein
LDKGLISRICKGAEKTINIKRTYNPTKWANKLFRQFSKELQITNKYKKKCSTFLAIKKMCIKMTLRFHLILVRMGIIKKTNSKCWQGCRGRRKPCTQLMGM